MPFAAYFPTTFLKVLISPCIFQGYAYRNFDLITCVVSLLADSNPFILPFRWAAGGTLAEERSLSTLSKCNKELTLWVLGL